MSRLLCGYTISFGMCKISQELSYPKPVQAMSFSISKLVVKILNFHHSKKYLLKL